MSGSKVRLPSIPLPQFPNGSCRGDTRPLWDDEIHGETDKLRQVRHALARAICADCPVRADCIAAAREFEEAATIGADRPTGVWGGRLFQTRSVDLDQRACEYCGQTFTPVVSSQLYCGARCRKQTSHARRWTYRTGYNPQVVDDVLNGEADPRRMSGPDRAEVVRRLSRQGRSRDWIASFLGVLPKSVARIQQRPASPTTQRKVS